MNWISVSPNTLFEQKFSMAINLSLSDKRIDSKRFDCKFHDFWFKSMRLDGMYHLIWVPTVNQAQGKLILIRFQCKKQKILFNEFSLFSLASSGNVDFCYFHFISNVFSGDLQRFAYCLINFFLTYLTFILSIPIRCSHISNYVWPQQKLQFSLNDALKDCTYFHHSS